MIIDLLQKKDQKKILLLLSLIQETYQPFRLCSKSYQPILLAELNNDFLRLQLPLSILGTGGSLKFVNPKNIDNNLIFLKLFNDYSLESPSIKLLDTLIDYTLLDKPFHTDSLSEDLHMTRQNLYKLIEKISVVLNDVQMQLFTKNSILQFSGNPINTISQIYRFYSLHYRYVYPPINFDLVRQNIAKLMIPRNSSYLHVESMELLQDMYEIVYGTESNLEERIEFFFQLLEDFGRDELDKAFLSRKIYKKSYSSIKLAKEASVYFNDYLTLNDNENSNYFFNTLILIIYSQNVVYRNFNTFVPTSKVRHSPELMAKFKAFNEKTNHRYSHYFTESFFDLLMFFLPVYTKLQENHQIKIHVKFSQTPVFEKVIKNKLTHFINHDLYIFENDPEKADIIISDELPKNSEDTEKNHFFFSDFHKQIDSPEFYSFILNQIARLEQ